MKSNVQENCVCALLLGEYQNDRLLVRDVFRKLGWRLFEARDRRRAMQCLDSHRVQVVLAESDLQGWNWRSVLTDLRGLPQPPQLIVTSRVADEYLWAEVLNIGGYDVLAQPLVPDEVERVVASAYRHFDFHPLQTRRRANSHAVGNVA
jgi:DNA-binding response OmpR family regulator